MRTIAAFLVLLVALPLSGQLADGDAHWNRRAENARGGRAQAAPIDAAIAAYERAIAAAPSSLEPRWKLMRALRFKGAYVAVSAEEKKAIYGRAKTVGDQALGVLSGQLAARKVSLAKGSEKQVADASRAIEGTAELFMWDAANWGEWALAYGKLAAARQGAADRIRRSANIAMLIDARVDGGGPGRILGRLHDQTPRIPFVTGWASSKEAVRFLTESLKVEPTSKITKTFLAEAMVANDASTKAKAVEMLRQVVTSPNHPGFAVEDAAAQDDARALLRKWGVSP